MIAAGLVPATAALAEDGRWRFPQQYSLTPLGTNLQTGRFTYSSTDVKIGNLAFTRSWGETSPAYAVGDRSLGSLATYSADVYSGWIPPNAGWSHNFNQGVYYWTGSSTALPRVYAVADGKVHTFIKFSSDDVVGPADQGSQGTRLVLSAGKWTLTDRAGTVFTYFAHPAIAQGGLAGNPMQVIESIVYADGTRLDFTYTTGGRPRFVRSNRGYGIGLEYDGSGNVSAACGFNLSQAFADHQTSCASAPVRTSYGYDSTGKKLVSVTDSGNALVTISYVAATPSLSLPSCITLANSANCRVQNAYGPQTGDTAQTTYADQVRQQTDATGNVWKYSYRPPADPLDAPAVVGNPRYSRSFMTDPSGASHGFKYDRGHLVLQSSPGQRLEYRYPYRLLPVSYAGYNEPTALQYHDSFPALVIPPELNRQFFAHDSRGNLTQHSYWPKGSANPVAPGEPNWDPCCVTPGIPQHPAGSITSLQAFLGDEGFTTTLGLTFVTGCGSGPADAKLCDKPLSRTDAKGNTTTYEYDALHGGLIKETGPAVAGGSPQTRHTYGLRSAWVKLAGGGYSKLPDGVYVRTETRFCKAGGASGNACAPGAADEVFTSYDYGPDSGPNNLQLRSVSVQADGKTLRTCYSYDLFGNKISETKPKGTCP